MPPIERRHQTSARADERVIYSAHCGARSQHPIGTVPARGIGHASLEYVQSGHDDEPTTPVESIAATHVAQLLSPIIDSRWVSHQLIDDRCGLRTDFEKHRPRRSSSRELARTRGNTDVGRRTTSARPATAAGHETSASAGVTTGPRRSTLAASMRSAMVAAARAWPDFTRPARTRPSFLGSGYRSGAEVI